MPLKIKDPISFDVLNQIDVRVGEILSVENVPDSRKLCQLLVDFGDFQRTILCGIQQERENPKEIEGKQALFVVNLAPRKMAGIMSEGIMYDIGYEDGIVPVLAIPEFKVPNGTRLG
ncbi:MAG: tRNA-binding protein [Erysipelotrichaceae bacterium]